MVWGFYAETGNVAQLIDSYVQRGLRFKNEDIRMYIAQITLGIMAMHIKNIIHRDIKTQNIFIAQNSILKIGDFGISRLLDTITPQKMTLCGTPYFMAPEVVLKKPYDGKADVWSLGIILYELITLKKPFDSDSIEGVFDLIVSAPYNPLDNDIDINLKILVTQMLQKDPHKRPTIFDVAQIPYINQQIQQFIGEWGFQEEVLAIFDAEAERTLQNLPLQTTLNEINFLSCEQLEEIAEMAREDIVPILHKVGWFGVSQRVIYGSGLDRRMLY